MTRYLLAALAFIAIVSVSYAGVVNSRLASSQAALASARSDLAVAQQHADRVERDRATAVAALEDERTRAVQAERQAAELRMQIARDADTDRDGPTAPVLRDAIIGSVAGDRR